MKKPFLLMAWDLDEAQGGIDDWIGCYETYEEAEKQVSIDSEGNYWVIDEEYYGVYEIIDLREWTDR